MQDTSGYVLYRNPPNLYRKPPVTPRWCTEPDAQSRMHFIHQSPFLVKSSQVKSIHKQQTTIRKPIECAPEASRGGREWAEMAEGDP